MSETPMWFSCVMASWISAGDIRQYGMEKTKCDTSNKKKAPDYAGASMSYDLNHRGFTSAACQPFSDLIC